MWFIQLSYEDQLYLREFYFKTQSSMDLQNEYDIFFTDIPTSYKMKVQQSLFDKCLMQNLIIKELVGERMYQNNKTAQQAPMIKFIIERMGTVFTSPEESIIREGDNFMDLFFIQRGDCLITQMG